ncbi:MAG: hypothetical protein QXJ75_05065 [Candidatus Bathyarchaeia archaeon]
MRKRPFTELGLCRSEDGTLISCKECYDRDYELYLSCLEKLKERLWEGIKCDPWGLGKRNITVA